MIRRISTILTIVLAAVVMSSGATGQPTPATAVEISAVGERAFEDVTRCLTSGKDKKLDVFYLIDQSGSLSRTDPNDDRVEILRNSVAELGNFVNQGVQVSVAAAGFANGVRDLQEWTPISSPSDAQMMGDELGRKILNASGQYVDKTDWESGLRLAKRYFDQRSDSCSMLIWFTDGGINPPDKTSEESLSVLCQPGISQNSLPTGGTQFGLMQEFRSAGIPIFGVLLNNEASQRDHYQSLYGSGWEEALAYENWLMSFMRALVEGRAEIAPVPSLAPLPGGVLTCGQVDQNGFAVAGQANGAFIDAADPVALAFQFLRISGQIAGGNGLPIIDGQFFVPNGTAGFQVIVSSEDWQLTGPEGSDFTASNQSPGGTQVSTSGGATRISVPVGLQDNLVGQWSLETSAQYSELFLFTGLTIELDRDKVSTILSDFDNTLSGRVVRVQEFAGLPVDLSLFSSAGFSVSILDQGVLVPQNFDVEFTPDGQFKIERFNPGQQVGDIELWLTLNLGEYFQPITSQFVLSIVDKTALATPSTDFVTLSVLEGPDGVARGELVVTGPNVSDSSTFCISSQPLRLDDVQAKGDQPVERLGEFSWSFAGLTPGVAGNCVEVAQGDVATITIEARNPTQANASVVSSWQIISTTAGTAAAYDAPIAIVFESATQSNPVAEIGAIVLLLLGGILLPLLVMWLINFWMTRFLPVESVMRASIPVTIDSSGPFTKVLDNRPGAEGTPLVVSPTDFRNIMDQPARRVIETERGAALAKVPVFPLAQTWYQWQAPPANRIISVFEGGTKHTKDMTVGRSVEISPNMAENWALVLPDSEFAKETGSALHGDLVVYSRMGNLDAYQKRVSELAMKPGLGERIEAITAAIANEAPLDKAEPVWTPGGDDPISIPSPPPGFTPSSSPGGSPDSPLNPPRPPQSGPLAPPPPPQ